MMFIIMLFCAVVLYFFVFKWHKYKENEENRTKTNVESDKFKLEHICTLIGIVVVAVLSTVFSINIGLISFAVAVVLLIAGFADEGAAIKAIPWNTLLMITGVGILISLVTDLGGIDLLSDGLRLLMGDKTAAAIMTVLAGVMSWVSSASGVVMPTLIPTVPALVADLSGVSSVALVTGICIGANAAAFSPLSSCGGLMLAAYSGSKVATTEGRNKMFAHLFFFSSACIGVSAVFALLGCFNWFG
jgi:di/tricarboxylate transporter